MKILAILGSARKRGHGYWIARRIEEALSERGDIEFEMVYLSDLDLGICRGCRVCFDIGDTRCPHGGDHLEIERKMIEADGIVLISPTYVGNVSGLMKNFIDRFAYHCHRPKCFNAHALLVTHTAGAAHRQAMLGLVTPAYAWAMNVVGMLTLKTPSEPPADRLTERQVARIRSKALKLYRAMARGEAPRPGLLALATFEARRRVFSQPSPGSRYEAQHYREQGWLDPECSYYTGYRAGPVRSALARLGARFFFGAPK